MKLVRVQDGDRVRPGILDGDNHVRDLSGHLSDIDGTVLSDAALARIAEIDLAGLPMLDSVRYAPCVGGVGKFLCIGLNYADHAEEAGMPIPEHPILFLKANSAIAGADDDIVIPRGSVATDWEVELGVVIGTPAKYVTVDRALDHVAGYCVINDVSERDFQLHRTGQWTKGKSCDSFGPIGPWLVTRDEVPDPQNLHLTLDVNGERMQDGSTRTMIFSVAEIVAHLSELFTLHPGDVIATGTPPGVGMGLKPSPRYLSPGDVVHTAIQGLGVQHQRVRADA
jgi:2-keto-4-pentenoate hydratase/2-oxohepta-3-ene-1,7-dioic acid hydratase in catechol pathway